MSLLHCFGGVGTTSGTLIIVYSLDLVKLFAYIGIAFMPPILGFIASKTSIILFLYLLFCILIMLIGSEKINVFMRKRGSNKSF